MPYITWEESVSALKESPKSGKPISPSLLTLEMEMRWKDTDFGSFKFTAIRKPIKVNLGTQDFVCLSPFSNLLFLENEKGNPFWHPFEQNIGISISAILCFVMRCTVVSYNSFFPPMHEHEGNVKLSFQGKAWAESWNNVFRAQEGLRSNVQNRHPTTEEEQSLIDTFIQIYKKLMSLDDETYHSVMGALHLYQLAFFVAHEDLSLSYSLLVASIDALSKNLRPKIKFKDIDSKGKLLRAMNEIGLEDSVEEAVKNLIVSGKGLTKAFCAFMERYLPETFWNGDHSLRNEMQKLGEEYWTGQYYTDLAEHAPPEVKEKLLKRAAEERRAYETFKKEHPRRDDRFPLKANREVMLKYLQTYFEKVLTNTFGGRSELFHSGKAFPKHTLKEETMDWVPDIFEDDLREFLFAHLGHKWNYELTDKGKIIRRCSCRDKKEIKVILGVRVFEKMVHDSVLNYIQSLGAA